MSEADRMLLDELTRQLSRFPFASTITVQGIPMSRSMARAMERQMLRLRVAERRAA